MLLNLFQMCILIYIFPYIRYMKTKFFYLKIAISLNFKAIYIKRYSQLIYSRPLFTRKLMSLQYLQCILSSIRIKVFSPGQEAQTQMIGSVPHIPKCCKFYSWSGRIWQATDRYFLSFSLCPRPLFFSLSSHSKINKHILRRELRKKIKVFISPAAKTLPDDNSSLSSAPGISL